MKKAWVTVLLVLVAAIVLSIPAATQEKEGQEKAGKAKAAPEARWSGVIVRLNKDTSTLTVRKQHIEKIIHFDSSTKWTKVNESIDPSQFTEGSRVICLGKYDEKKEFVATRIDLREPHRMP